MRTGRTQERKDTKGEARQKKDPHTHRMETRKADNTAEKERSLEMFGENSRDKKKIGRRKPAHTSLESGREKNQNSGTKQMF